MEYLSFNPQGQWTLCKATAEAGTLKEPGATRPGQVNKPLHSVSHATRNGQLPEDHGQRGTLHNFNQGKRPKPAVHMSPRKWGKPTHNVSSAYANQNPGIANPSV